YTTNPIDVPGPIAVAPNLSEGETYYFAAKAYNIDGIYSEFSDEISYTVPGGSPGPTPTPTATATPVPSSSPTATATASPVPSPSPTLTPTPTPFARDLFDDASSVNITSRPMVTGQSWIAASSWSGTMLTAGGGNAYSTASNKMDVISAD